MTPSFSSPPVVVGLDIGTTKICALVASEGEDASLGSEAAPDGSMQILGVGIVPSVGVRRGVVVDVPDTIAAIKEAIVRAAHMAGVEIEGVMAGVTGDHIISQNRIGSVTVASRGNQVSNFDVDRALAAALLEVGRDREIIHSLPLAFAVNEERGIKTPLGMVGTRLEVETHVVTGQSSILRNTLNCISGAGVRADGLALEPLASAEAVTTRSERQMGALVLDIGGGTTDLAAYFDGAVIYSAALPVGGNHVTRDLSIGLSTPFEFAEKLKVGSGAATRDMIPHGEALEVLTAGGSSRLRIPRAILGEIIEARMRELFEISLSMAVKADLQGLVPGGLILSGGGALLPGSVELASHIFGLPARLGVPEGMSGWSEPVSSPQFSTAVGLCRLALAQKRQSRQRAASTITLPNARRVWSQLAPGVTMARPMTVKPAPPSPSEEEKTPAPVVAAAPVPTVAPTSSPNRGSEEFPAQMQFSATPSNQGGRPSIPSAAPIPAPQPNGVPVAEPAVIATVPTEPVAVPVASEAPPVTEAVAVTEEATATTTSDETELVAQRNRLRALLPRIDETRADAESARSAPVPISTPQGEEQTPPEKAQPTWWNRFLKFIGFDESE